MIIGTRPEAIKLAILCKLLKQNPLFDTHICFTGQHNNLVPQVFDFFDLQADIQPKGSSNDGTLTERMISIQGLLNDCVLSLRPDLIVVQGDTLSAYCGAQMAYLNRIPLAHVEAGLRTYDRKNPFPEDVFRRFIDSVSDYLFAPSQTAVDNLLTESVEPSSIYMVGNTGKDAVLWLKNNDSATRLPLELEQFIASHKSQGCSIVLLTMHRRENQENLIKEVYQRLLTLVKESDLALVFVDHPHTSQKHHFQPDSCNVCHVQALSFGSFIRLVQEVDLILTDSGGLQEEAAYLQKPTLILRNATERTELVKKGMALMYSEESFENDIFKLIGTNISPPETLYGVGDASKLIADTLQCLLTD